MSVARTSCQSTRSLYSTDLDESVGLDPSELEEEKNENDGGVVQHELQNAEGDADDTQMGCTSTHHEVRSGTHEVGSEETSQITVELNSGAATDVGGVSTAIPTEVGDVVDIEETLPAGEMETQRTSGHETSVVHSTIQFGLDTEDVGEDTAFAGDIESDIGNEQQSCLRKDRSTIGLEDDDQHDVLVDGHPVDLTESDECFSVMSVCGSESSHTHECIEDYDLDEKVKEILEQDQMGVENTALPIAKVGKRSHRDETDSELLRVEQGLKN
ncbi:hypothetical protein PInf_018205 [Phytophthora infestans]|nr:hypothetical protein PInf_018205 [Phytophthora infestans]